MPNTQSLWIDEGFSAPYAAETSFGGFLERLTNDPGSEALMPLSVFSRWAGGQVFGRSEIGLRVVSSLWAVIALVIMWRLGSRVGMPWMATVFACHPFLWYYAGEVRPYATVFAMGAGLLLGAVAATTPSPGGRPAIGWFLVFGPLLCASNILGVVPFAIVVFLVANEWRKNPWTPIARDWVGLAASGGALAGVAGYYLWSLGRGAETISLQLWSKGIAFATFAGFELLGFMGFSPGRYELRQLALESGLGGAIRGLIGPTSIGLVILAGVYSVLAVRFISRLRLRPWSRNTRSMVLASLVILGTLGAALAVSVAIGSPFWGRHVATLLPFIVFVVVVSGGGSDDSASGRPNTLTIVLALALLASSFFVRWNPAHWRDDYRSASRIARHAIGEGKTVWWAAAPETAGYYGVRFCSEDGSPQTGCVRYVTDADEAALAKLDTPDLIILSKPELHDSSGAIRGVLDGGGFRVTDEVLAFQIFER